LSIRFLNIILVEQNYLVFWSNCKNIKIQIYFDLYSRVYKTLSILVIIGVMTMVNRQPRGVLNYNMILYNAKAGIILKNVYFFTKQNRYLNIYSMFIDNGFFNDNIVQG
jgi:hypothetical protein